MALESNKSCATCRFMKPGHSDGKCASCVAFCNWKRVACPNGPYFQGVAIGGPLAGRTLAHSTPLLTCIQGDGVVLATRPAYVFSEMKEIKYLHQEIKVDDRAVGLWLAHGVTLFSAISEMVQLYQDRQDDQERM